MKWNKRKNKRKIKDKKYLTGIGKKTNRELEYYIFEELKKFSEEELSKVDFKVHVWKRGDTMAKLAQRAWGDFRHWRVIALINEKNMDHDIEVGENIIVPINLDYVLGVILGDL